MGTDTYFGNTGDGYLESQGGASYANARAGSATLLAWAASDTFMYVGQYFDGASYYCYEAFTAFDTSGLPDYATVTAATLSMWLIADGSATDFTAQARVKTWLAGGLTTADWVAGASLTSTLLATLATSGIGATGAYKDFTDVAMPANVSLTGNTEMILDSSRQAGNNTPTGDESVNFQPSVHTGTTQDPKLVVVHTDAVTPGVLALTTTKYAPVIKSTIVTPLTTVALTTYAPVIATKVVVPVTALTTTKYAPTIINTTPEIATAYPASYLLLETGDKILQETGDKILLQTQAVAISGVTQTGVMLENFSLTECANRGEVGTGGFDVYDSAAALTIPALRAAVVSEPLSLSAPLLYSGYTHERSISPIQNGVARAWGVEVTDLNILAREYVLTEAESADRPVETDYTRIAWLMTTRFATAEAGIIVGVLPNTNTVTMEATDYRGRTAADVLAECSEAAGKLWFIYHYDESGRGLYYDLATGTYLRTTTKISDAGDADGSTIFHPIGTPTVTKSPDRIYSTVHLTYNGGTVSRTNATTATTYRTREIAVTDNSINDATLATVKADALLAAGAAELTEIDGLEIVVPALYVNSVRAGNAVQIKLIRQGITDYAYYRVVRRTIQPTGTADNRYYHLSLGLASDVLPSASGGGREVYQNTSNANDDGATVLINRSGLTITDGAITVTSAGATVIIDGTSNMFKIVATGTLTLTGVVNNPGNSTTSTTDIATGLTYRPAYLGYFITGTSAYTVPYAINTMTIANAGVVVDVWEMWAQVVNTDQTRISFKETTSRNSGTTQAAYQCRYYVLKEAAI